MDRSLLNLNKQFIKEQVPEKAQVNYAFGANYNNKCMLTNSPDSFDDDVPEYDALDMNYNFTPLKCKIIKSEDRGKEPTTDETRVN